MSQFEPFATSSPFTWIVLTVAGPAGTVSFVSPVAEFTPKNVQTPEERAKLVFRVKIDLDNPDGVFKPGMPADATFAAPPPGSQPTAHGSQLLDSGPAADREAASGLCRLPAVGCRLFPAVA